MKFVSITAALALFAGTSLTAPVADAPVESSALEARQAGSGPITLVANKPGYDFDSYPFEARHGRIYLGGVSETQSCPSGSPSNCYEYVTGVFKTLKKTKETYMDVLRHSGQQLYVNKVGALSYAAPGMVPAAGYKTSFTHTPGWPGSFTFTGSWGAKGFYACPVAGTSYSWQVYVKTPYFKKSGCTPFSSAWAYSYDPTSQGEAWAYAI